MKQRRSFSGEAMGSDFLKRICRAQVCCANSLIVGLTASRSHPPRVGAGGDNPRQDFATRILSTLQFNTEFTNHEAIPSLDEVLSGLMAAMPQYFNTVLADSIRGREYFHLSKSHMVCLDYIGQGLFSNSQILSSVSATDIASSSSNPPIAASQACRNEVHFFDVSPGSPNLMSYLVNGSSESRIEAEMRQRIMKYMNLSAEDYSLVFTANESSAFKLVAECYPFQSNQSLLTMYDHENEAIKSMISSSKKRGARAQSALFSWPNLRIKSGRLKKVIVNRSKMKNRGLFVFPLHSRITGSQYSYQWMNLARENGWHVLLDGSALAPKEMETLGLSLFQPDFLICSFYKIFGQNPTGFCCLFIKKTINEHLIQTPPSMGIINLVPPQIQTNYLEPEKSHEIENGREEIHCRGLDQADALGLILISTRLRCLSNWLINALLSLRHPNSGTRLPLVRIFGPKIKLNRGPAVAFNVYDWRGERVEPILVQKLASRNNIAVNCGYLRNLWFPENLSEEQKLVENGRRTGASNEGFGVVSVSLSLMNDLEDVYTFWCFIARFLDADYVEKEKWRYFALNLKTIQL